MKTKKEKKFEKVVEYGDVLFEWGVIIGVLLMLLNYLLWFFIPPTSKTMFLISSGFLIILFFIYILSKRKVYWREIK